MGDNIQGISSIKAPLTEYMHKTCMIDDWYMCTLPNNEEIQNINYILPELRLNFKRRLSMKT